MSLPSVNYQALELERTSEIQEDLKNRLVQSKNKEGYGRSDSLKNSVLTQVVHNNYESALNELKFYIEFKSEYPSFQNRVQRYLDHCDDLIHAIDTKRNFPGLGALSLSKQQEIYERVLDHFEELKSYLGQIEQVERDVKLADVRSTVWFVKTLSNAAIFILVVGFTLDVINGLGSSFHTVLNDMTSRLTDVIFNLFQ